MKGITKILSVFLAVLMILTTVECITPVFAQEIALNELEREFDPEDSLDFVAEEESSRTANSKTYLMSDGSFEHGIFSYNVTGSANGPMRAPSHNRNNNSVSATYVKSTDGEDDDHSDEENILVGSNSYGFVEIPTVAELNNYHVKTAYLYLPVVSGSTDAVVYAYYLDKIDDSTSFSYSDIASHIRCIDYATVKEYGDDGKYISLDVTSALRSDSGMVVLGSSSSVTLGKSISNADDNDTLFMASGAPKVVFSYNYIITAGLDDDFEYTSFDLGAAGTAYINKQSGNLVIKRDDIATGSGEHAYEINSAYNSMSTLGSGMWMHNFDASVAFLGLLYIDENATVSVLYPEEEEGEDDNVRKLKKNNYGFTTLEILETQTTEYVLFENTVLECTISIPSATRYLLTADEGATRYTYTSEYNLTEIAVKDENDTYRTVMGKYPDPNDESGNSYYIADADENKIHVSVSENSKTMTQILPGGGIGDVETITTDEEGNVISVEKNGQTVSAYTYDSANRMTSVENDKGYRLEFEYNSADDEGSYKVVSVQEFQNTTAGKKTTYSRTYDSCTERTEGVDGVFNNGDDVLTKYSFDNNCRLICTQAKTADGEELDSVSYSYNDNEVSGVASSGRIADNCLKNHNVESLTDWTPKSIDDSACDYSAVYTTEESFVGNGSVKVTVNDMTATGGAGVYQEFTVSDSSVLQRGGEYVVSAHIKTAGISRDADTSDNRNFGAAAMIRLGFNDGTSSTRSYTEAVKDSNGEWERVFTWVSIPENCNKLTVYLLVRNGTGTAYFDGIQLEKGRVPSEYNLLENNSFDYSESTTGNTGNNWIRKYLSSSDGISDGSFVIGGDVSKNKYIYQDVVLTEADQNKSYVLKAVARGSSMPFSKAAFSVRLRTFYEDGTYGDSSATTKFNAYNYEEQYVQAAYSVPPSATGSKAVKIRVYFMYYKNLNQVEVKTINLIESNNVFDYTDNTVVEKDENGNIIRSVDESGNVTTYTYNNNKVKLSETTVDAEGNTVYHAEYNALGDIISENNNGEVTTYTYSDGKLLKTVFTDSQENVTTTDYVDGVISSVVTKTKENAVTYTATYDSFGCILSETEDGSTTTYTYTRDSFGNILSSVCSDGTTENYIYSYFDDDNDGENDRSELDSSYTLDSDGVTRYYDKESRLIREEKDGSVISLYAYDSSGNLISKTENGKTIAYSYSDGNLASVTRNSNSYNYTYDVWGNKKAVKIGSQTLESYSYKPNHGVLSKKTYGNGSTEKYSYNSYGMVSNVNAVGVGSYSFNYDSKGILVYTRDNVGNFRTYYKYDKQGRNIGEHVVSTVNSNAYSNDLYNTALVYDDEGRVTQSTVSSVNGTVKNSYAYDSTDDGNDRTVSTFTSTRGVTSVYDSESRITTRTISTKSPYVQSYTYDSDGYVSQEISGTSVFAYTYDDDGKITEIKKDGVLRQSYVYDSEGQLIRENNLDSNSTILYNYDGYGNITSRVSYPYTTGTVGEATGTVSYTYGDSSWKDKLTAFNGEAVSYDAIGNPTTYRGATATWFGRQMQSYSKGSNSITYKYDENGLRTSKTVNGVQHDYYYVDSVLIYEKVGSDYELFYRYDNEGKLSMIVRYNFDEAKNYYYNVVTNTQGDVVRILSGSGAILVEYTYDAWGKIVSIKNGSGTAITSSSNIGIMNSVRYRGYVYDTETGLYYLQSRYYDPEVGRFINCDDPEFIGYNDTEIGWNGFVYCHNNPIMYKDKTGYAAVAAVAATLGVSTSTLVATALLIIIIVDVITGGKVILTLSEAIALVIESMFYNISSSGVSQKTRTLSDTKAKLPESKVYQLAYINENGFLVRFPTKYSFVEALKLLGFSSAKNTLRQDYIYNKEKGSTAQNMLQPYSKKWGIYTNDQKHAKALASVCGAYMSPEVHGSGKYGHYHDFSHAFHIWYGGIITY